MFGEAGKPPGAGGGEGARVLIYSHDTFGLGHLSRCRTIAHALVENHKHLSVLIISGSPIIGSFPFRARVDFVRIPGVIKLRDGEYTALGLHIDLKKTLEMRSSIIRGTAETFDPDVFIVDKEPLGLRGEVHPTLRELKRRGRTHLVLGLRDVLDEPTLLVPEWQRKNAAPALSQYYDEIWIYGLPQIWEPLASLNLPKSVLRKIAYTGYLRRSASVTPPTTHPSEIPRRPYLLVTTGGGNDGEGLIEWVLRAYETDPLLPYPALLMLGPFMMPELQERFKERAARLARVEAITFDPNIENLERDAAGIVSMGGYNTFCEILSHDQRAIIVPRTVPRREQYIRAARAHELGLIRMLEDDGNYRPEVMAEALRALPRQRRPSEIVVPGLLEGLVNVNRLIEPWVKPRAESDDDAVIPHRA